MKKSNLYSNIRIYQIRENTHRVYLMELSLIRMDKENYLMVNYYSLLNVYLSFKGMISQYYMLVLLMVSISIFIINYSQMLSGYYMILETS